MSVLDKIWNSIRDGMVLNRPRSQVKVSAVTDDYIEYAEISGNGHTIRLYKDTFRAVYNKVQTESAKGNVTGIDWFVKVVKKHRSNFYVSGHLLLSNKIVTYDRGGYKLVA